MLEKCDAVRQFLKTTLIPMENRCPIFVGRDVSLLNKMIWLLAVIAGRTELGSKVDGSKPLFDYEKQENYALSM